MATVIVHLSQIAAGFFQQYLLSRKAFAFGIVAVYRVYQIREHETFPKAFGDIRYNLGNRTNRYGFLHFRLRYQGQFRLCKGNTTVNDDSALKFEYLFVHCIIMMISLHMSILMDNVTSW